MCISKIRKFEKSKENENIKCEKRTNLESVQIERVEKNDIQPRKSKMKYDNVYLARVTIRRQNLTKTSAMSTLMLTVNVRGRAKDPLDYEL